MRLFVNKVRLLGHLVKEHYLIQTNPLRARKAIKCPILPFLIAVILYYIYLYLFPFSCIIVAIFSGLLLQLKVNSVRLWSTMDTAIL